MMVMMTRNRPITARIAYPYPGIPGSSEIKNTSCHINLNEHRHTTTHFHDSTNHAINCLKGFIQHNHVINVFLLGLMSKMHSFVHKNMHTHDTKLKIKALT